jgi:hypothetical protein
MPFFDLERLLSAAFLKVFAATMHTYPVNKGLPGGCIGIPVPNILCGRAIQKDMIL